MGLSEIPQGGRRIGSIQKGPWPISEEPRLLQHAGVKAGAKAELKS